MERSTAGGGGDPRSWGGEPLQVLLRGQWEGGRSQCSSRRDGNEGNTPQHGLDVRLGEEGLQEELGLLWWIQLVFPPCATCRFNALVPQIICFPLHNFNRSNLAPLFVGDVLKAGRTRAGGGAQGRCAAKNGDGRVRKSEVRAH